MSRHRLAIAAALIKAGFDPQQARDRHGQWTGDGNALLIPARMTLPDGADTSANGTSIFGELTPAAIAALARYGLRLGGITTALGIIFIPTDSGAVVEGRVPNRPDIRFQYDKPEGVLRVWQESPSGELIVYHAKPDRDGIFRDEAGRPVARRLSDDSLVIDQDSLPKPDGPAGDDRDEPKLCPTPVEDRPGARPKDVLYEAYVSTLVNPGTPTPPGYAVTLVNPETGKDVYFDDCRRVDGTMIEAKGTGYQKMLEKKSRFPRAGVVEDALKQADRQLKAAGGRRVEWYVAEKPVADHLVKLFRDKDIKITIIWAPPP